MLKTDGNYCAYLRKSRKDLEAEAHGEGETLARHEHILLDLAKQLNISLHAIYKEIVSGETIAARPVVQRVLREVEQGFWDGVLVVEVERLARGDTRDQGYISEAFTYSDTLIITPLKIYNPSDPSDSEYFEFNLFMSRREYKTINRRLETGRHQSFLEGKFIGNIAPYGWERYKLSKQRGFSLRPDPAESKYLKMMYDLIAYGADGVPVGPDKVANLFNKMGVPTRNNGSTWTGVTIRGIIENEHNIGMVRLGHRKTVKKMQNGQLKKIRPRQKSYELANGMHEGQISEETFKIANEHLSSASLPVNRDYTVKNPLAGIIYCSCCGHAMRRRPTHTKAAYDFLYCPYGCGTVGSPLYVVEKVILDILNDWTSEYELKDVEDTSRFDEMIALKQSALSELDEDLRKLSVQRGNLYDLLEQGIYDTDVFLSRQKEISDREKALKEKRTALMQEIEYESKIQADKANFIPRCKKLIDNYNYLSVQDKNRFLKELIDRIVYTKTERNKRGCGNTANFQLEIYPRVPRS